LRALLKKAVQGNIETKRLSGHCRERLFRISHESNLGLWMGLELAIPWRSVRRYSHQGFGSSTSRLSIPILRLFQKQQ